MRSTALVDSGPLVAIFDADDERHNLAVEFIKDFRYHGLVHVPVITEVMYLLDFDVRIQTAFLRWLDVGPLQVIPLESADFARTAEVMEKYRDLPADFADAVTISVCERLSIRHIATFDSDFRVFRLKNRSSLINIFPQS